MNPPASIDAQIRLCYPTLSATDRRLADVVLARGQTLLGYSATELAQLAGASKASAARFFRRLGYADFQAFRAQLRGQAASHAPLYRLPAGQAARTSGNRLQQHVDQDRATLERLPTTLDAATLQQAVTALLQARRVWIAGYRNAHAVAFYAQALLHQVRAQVSLLDDGTGRDSESLADLDRRDLVLAIDLRRRTRRLPLLLQAVRNTGARLLLLTDAAASHQQSEGDLVLRCPTHAAELFDSYVAPVSVVNFIAGEVAARGALAARRRLARIEDLHVGLDDLDPPPEASRRKSS
jgi:DNA-binding MurR/RpiR family transcriptional regulator